MLTVVFKVIFSFAEVGFCGFLTLFVVFPYYFYSFLKHWLIQKFSAKFRRFKRLLNRENDEFLFQLLPYPVKRRFIQLLPANQLEIFQKIDKTHAKMAQLLRGTKITELVFDLGAIFDSCIVKHNFDLSESAIIVPSNLISAELSIFKKHTNFEKIGIIGTSYPRDSVIDQILSSFPNNFTCDCLFADFEVENLEILVRLLDKTKPVKLIFSLGFHEDKPDLDQILKIISDKVEEIQ